MGNVPEVDVVLPAEPGGEEAPGGYHAKNDCGRLHEGWWTLRIERWRFRIAVGATRAFRKLLSAGEAFPDLY